MRLRLGCVPFLNAKPLVAWFSEGDEMGAEVVFDDPSRLGPMVDAGEVAAALASSYFAVSEPGWNIAAGVSISSDGPVRSVRLFSKKPFAEIETLALDQASMTSNHLARIWLQEVHNCKPAAELQPANLEAMLDRFDAAVLIGDAGMAADAADLLVADLGDEWTKLTGRPFVWAVWMGKKGLTPELAEQLLSAKNYGIKNLSQIAGDAAQEVQAPYEDCLDYLQNAIDFDLTEQHLESLALFGEKCKQHGFIRQARMPVVVSAPAPLTYPS